MSRLFDALQRSGVEQTGVEYPDTVSVTTKVFEMPDGAVEEEAAPVVEVAEFPTLPVSIDAASGLVFLSEPESLAAEKFRFLGVRMRQLQQTRPLKRILVTSTISEEGKSTVSANLAGVLAHRKKHKVLLVEGDLRRPVLARRFGLGRMDGLAEWLRSDLQGLTNIYYLKGPDFWIMPAGLPPENPLELLQSGRLSKLFEQLTAMFDWIVVDSPPLLPLADTTVWQRVTDGVLLVVREGATEKTPLERGLEILKKSDLLGVVLNDSSTQNHHSYYQRYAVATRLAK
jgi:capsular exopolysaccharide synthesis family protein